jgi:hypothetical protein
VNLKILLLEDVRASATPVLSELSGAEIVAGLNVSQLHLETAGGFGAAVVDSSAPLDAATLATVECVHGIVRAFVACAGTNP